MNEYWQTFVSFLRDPIWQGISALVAIAAFLYFLYDRYITNAQKVHIKRTLFIIIISFAVSGGLYLLISLFVGFEKTKDNFLGAWLGLGTILSIFGLFVEKIINDERKTS